MPLINSQARLDNDWIYLSTPDKDGETNGPALSEVIDQPVKLVVDWGIWQAHKEDLLARDADPVHNLGVKIDGDNDLDELSADLGKLALIAIDFPSFADGRGFSLARLLRQRYGFKGEIRAVGAVSWDRLRYMHRCGFDTYDIPEERFDDAIFRAFTEVQVSLQGAVDDPRPIYRQ